MGWDIHAVPLYSYGFCSCCQLLNVMDVMVCLNLYRFQLFSHDFMWSITELHMSPLFSSKMCLESSELGLLYARTKEGNGLQESVQVLPVL